MLKDNLMVGKPDVQPDRPTHVPSGTSRSRWSTAVIGP